MNGPVLVAYATRYGSTREVAEAVAEAMRGEGVNVDVREIREVRSLEVYQGIVVGSPLQMTHWHKDALKFIGRHRAALSVAPVAVFALGPTTNAEKDWTAARDQLDKELARFPWLNPVSVRVFGGKFDPAALHFPFNVLPGMKRLPSSDIRDWDAIRQWGRELVTL